jgi:hypothetical protein
MLPYSFRCPDPVAGREKQADFYGIEGTVLIKRNAAAHFIIFINCE